MRSGEEKRKTNETDIFIKINLDGCGKSKIDTRIGFFNHMLELFACHSGFDLEVICDGDIHVDAHHSVEDIGIVMGKLINSLLGDKKGINRYASFYVPMDESLVRTVIDLSGRPFLAFNGDLKGAIGNFDLELICEFFRALAMNGLITVHIDILSSGNLHHTAEAIFKSFARTLKDAVKVTGNTIPSSKGVL